MLTLRGSLLCVQPKIIGVLQSIPGSLVQGFQGRKYRHLSYFSKLTQLSALKQSGASQSSAGASVPVAPGATHGVISGLHRYRSPILGTGHWSSVVKTKQQIQFYLTLCY